MKLDQPRRARGAASRFASFASRVGLVQNLARSRPSVRFVAARVLFSLFFLSPPLPSHLAFAELNDVVAITKPLHLRGRDRGAAPCERDPSGGQRVLPAQTLLRQRGRVIRQ